MTKDSEYCVPDLQKERANCPFDKTEIIHLLDGSKNHTEVRRSLEELFFADPDFLDPIPPDYMSHEERYSNDLRKACRVVQLINNEEKFQQLVGQMEGIRMVMGSGLGSALNKDGNPLAVHFVMFLPALLGQGNYEQSAYWVPKAWSGEIIGTYAQTELGHGTYLRGLETTATYDPSSEEFVLNSPTISSFKFWPGGLGKTANHAVVMAQLYTKGRCYGPHAFIVQLRDTKTHRSLPGVSLGEIGPKMGLHTNDNGCLGFKNYRIPRTNMLMKHTQVLKDGTYVQPPSDKLSYGTMVFVRVAICFDTAKQLAKAVTIAVRYSAVRHQSKILPDEPEPQILDYQTQQYKLIPHIASIFALQFAAENLFKTFNDVTQDINQGNLELLPELHALSCGLKAQSSFDSTYGIDACRLACGGNGFIASSNLPRIFCQATAAITYEGENTVMLLQVARYILKSHQARTEMSEDHSLKYLKYHQRDLVRSDISNEGLLRKWEVSVSHLLDEVSSRIHKLRSKGMKPELAWNASSVSLVAIAQAHIRYFTCDQFVKKLKELSVSPPTKAVLEKLCRLYFLYHTGLNQGLLLRSGSISSSELAIIENEMMALLADLRKNAVNLVDSFDIHDRILNSTLGSWDGNVYERLYNESLKSPMNQKDVVPAIQKYLQPLMKSNL